MKPTTKSEDHGANADKNYNGDYTGCPFKYGSSFHSLATDEHRSNTDYKPACSRFPVGSANKNQFKASQGAATVIGAEVSVFSHERLNLAYDTIEFVDEV